MKCWFCEDDARAVCSFCGRGVCRDHASKMAKFVGMFLGGENTPKGLAVADVIWCGECQPQPEPIAMPELF